MENTIVTPTAVMKKTLEWIVNGTVDYEVAREKAIETLNLIKESTVVEPSMPILMNVRNSDRLHFERAHPGYEYTTTRGQVKNFDASIPPPGEGWIKNVFSGDKGWLRLEFIEEAYWMRPKE